MGAISQEGDTEKRKACLGKEGGYEDFRLVESEMCIMSWSGEVRRQLVGVRVLVQRRD